MREHKKRNENWIAKQSSQGPNNRGETHNRHHEQKVEARSKAKTIGVLISVRVQLEVCVKGERGGGLYVSGGLSVGNMPLSAGVT